MKLLELEARTYIGREYKEYLRSQEEDSEEGNEWKKSLGPTVVPKTYPSRVLVDPARIIMAIESYSVEELAANPEHPEFDTVDLCLMDGVQLSIVGNLDSFQSKLNEFNENN